MTDSPDTPPPDDVYIYTDADGLPVGAVDLADAERRGIRLALDLAEHCGDQDIVLRMSPHVSHLPPADVGYVTINALRTLANDVLEPLLQACDQLHEAGLLDDMRARLAASAEQTRNEL